MLLSAILVFLFIMQEKMACGRVGQSIMIAGSHGEWQVLLVWDGQGAASDNHSTIVRVL